MGQSVLIYAAGLAWLAEVSDRRGYVGLAEARRLAGVGRRGQRRGVSTALQIIIIKCIIALCPHTHSVYWRGMAVQPDTVQRTEEAGVLPCPGLISGAV